MSSILFVNLDIRSPLSWHHYRVRKNAELSGVILERKV